MRRYWSRYISLLLIIAIGCNSNDEAKQDLMKLDWKPLGGDDFSYVVTEHNDDASRKEDNLEVVLVEVRRRSDNAVVDSSIVTRNMIEGIRSSVIYMLKSGGPENVIKQNSTGYIKFDIGTAISNFKPSAQVYLRLHTVQSDIDSLMFYIEKLPQVDTVIYISKELALERWIASGQPDPMKELDENPLPASLQVTFEGYYAYEDSLNDFAAKSLNYFPLIVQDTKFSKQSLEFYWAFKNYIFVFSYKT